MDDIHNNFLHCVYLIIIFEPFKSQVLTKKTHVTATYLIIYILNTINNLITTAMQCRIHSLCLIQAVNLCLNLRSHVFKVKGTQSG